MKVAIFVDNASNAIDNAMQRNIISKINNELIKIHDTFIIDPLIIGIDEAINILIKQQYDVLFTYNKTGTNLTLSNELNLISNIKKLHICWLTEHPVTFYEQYFQSQNNRHYIFTNEAHSNFANEMDLKGTYSASLFGSTPIKNFKNIKNRLYDICIAVQWRGFVSEEETWKNFNSKTKNFLHDVIALEEIDNNKDIHNAYLIAAAIHKINLENKKIHAQNMRGIYWYIRKLERIKLVQDIANTGLNILLIGGEQWKKVIPNSNNITFAPPCDQKTVIEYYKISKSVVCTNCYNGASERVFDALSAGSIAITENSPALKNILIDKESCVFYMPNKFSDIKDDIINLLKDNNAKKISEAGNSIFLNNHTWENRAKFISNIITTDFNS
jgi:glycosyltransferase involved in cell wall biosynthesis